MTENKKICIFSTFKQSFKTIKNNALNLFLLMIISAVTTASLGYLYSQLKLHFGLTPQNLLATGHRNFVIAGAFLPSIISIFNITILLTSLLIIGKQQSVLKAIKTIAKKLHKILAGEFLTLTFPYLLIHTFMFGLVSTLMMGIQLKVIIICLLSLVISTFFSIRYFFGLALIIIEEKSFKASRKLSVNYAKNNYASLILRLFIFVILQLTPALLSMFAIIKPSFTGSMIYFIIHLFLNIFLMSFYYNIYKNYKNAAA